MERAAIRPERSRVDVSTSSSSSSSPVSLVVVVVVVVVIVVEGIVVVTPMIRGGRRGDDDGVDSQTARGGAVGGAEAPRRPEGCRHIIIIVVRVFVGEKIKRVRGNVLIVTFVRPANPPYQE